MKNIEFAFNFKLYLCYVLHNHLLQGLSNFACDMGQSMTNATFKIQLTVSHSRAFIIAQTAEHNVQNSN